MRRHVVSACAAYVSNFSLLLMFHGSFSDAGGAESDMSGDVVGMISRLWTGMKSFHGKISAMAKPGIIRTVRSTINIHSTKSLK